MFFVVLIRHADPPTYNKQASVFVQPFARAKDVWTGEMTCDEAFLELIKMLGWQEKVRRIQHLLPESNQDRIKHDKSTLT